MKPLISHEIPKSLFSEHDLLCEYPYLLAHLLSKKYHYDEAYATFYKACVKRFDYSILDNSAYELKMPVETDVLVDVANEFKPSHIVIPDIFRDFKATTKSVEDNLPKLLTTNCKMFAVIQGNTIQEMLDCYDFYNQIPEIDVIGINYLKIPGSNNASRLDFFRILLQSRKITKKIHFLGCENPGEFKAYKLSELQYVHSIDTSSPIVNGWKGNRFTENGLECNKPIEIIADNLDIVLCQDQLNDIAHNFKTFRNYVFNKPFN